MRRSRHCVGSLTAAGGTGIRKVLRGIAPYNVANFPGHTKNLSTSAMDIDHRFRSQIADARLELDPALRRNNQQSVESDCTANVGAQRDADAARLGSTAFGLARCFFLPLELLRAAVQRFFEETTGRVASHAFDGYSEFRLALRAIDAAQSHLVNAEFARSLGKDGFDEGDSLHSAGRALCAARRRIGHHRNCALTHSRWLVQQRDNASRRCTVALRVIRATVANREHVNRCNPAILGKADLHAANKTWARATDVVLFLAADAHHHRSVELFGQERRNDHGDAAGDLAAKSAAGVLADENDLVYIDVHPFRNRRLGLESALRS